MNTRILQLITFLLGALFVFVACGKGKLRPLPEDRMGSLGRLAKIQMNKLENDSDRLAKVREVYYKEFDPSSEANKQLFDAIEGLTIEGVDVDRNNEVIATDIKVHILLKAVEKTVIFSRRFSSENLKKTLSPSDENKNSGSPYEYAVEGICFEACMYIYIMVTEARQGEEGAGVSIGRADFLAKISGEGENKSIQIVQPSNITSVEAALAARNGTTPEAPANTPGGETETTLSAQQKYDQCKADMTAMDNCETIIADFEADGMAQMCSELDISNLLDEPKCWESRKELFEAAGDAINIMKMKRQACDLDNARAEALGFQCAMLAEQITMLEERQRCDELKLENEEAWNTDEACQSLSGASVSVVPSEDAVMTEVGPTGVTETETEIVDAEPDTGDAAANAALNAKVSDCSRNPVQDIDGCLTAFRDGMFNGDETEAIKFMKDLGTQVCESFTGDERAQWDASCNTFSDDPRFGDSEPAPALTAEELAADNDQEDMDCPAEGTPEYSIGLNGYEIPESSASAIFKNMEPCQIEQRGWGSANRNACQFGEMDRCNVIHCNGPACAF